MRKTDFFLKKMRFFTIRLLILFLPGTLFSQTQLSISDRPSSHSFPLFSADKVCTIHVAEQDFAGVKRVAVQLQADIERTSGKRPPINTLLDKTSSTGVIIGTIGHNSTIDKLIAEKHIDVSQITGKRESFIIQVVPVKDAKQLIIAGSDKRGTIYGMYHLAEELGISPWYWWADVPVKKRKAAHITANYVSSEPVVEYRGIFINDEAPALTGWVNENFGGFNAKFYEKVFELILRLKGNFLWPAMWGEAFYEDDPQNPVLADEYGVIIGTSHHEPMMRAHDEWRRFGNGPWNYEKNKEALQKFWTDGIKRMGTNESIVTVGMRGDGDEAMTEGTAIELLENIISDQRKIISEVTDKPAEQIPQAWALYKEVQDYYDKGMRVPDDVLLLLCDDNWGNIRVLPEKKDWNRTGGFGIYYHFDFVGGPVSYRWLNVTQIEKVWEQMNLAYAWDAKKLWLVNVGDIKPMEFPISFFLDFAWNPEAITPQDLPDYYRKWSRQQFGDEFANEIAGILASYTKFNARRTPEMIRPDTYSLTDYREAERILTEYNTVVEKSKQIYEKLPKETKAAFYQLVLFPVEICANLNDMYVAVAKNKLYAEQKRASTNFYAQKVKILFEKDKSLTDDYHHKLANGKWNHFMSQTHIGYTSWNNPPENVMPEVTEFNPADAAGLGIMVEGNNKAGSGQMPIFDPLNQQEYYIEIYNTGLKPLEYKILSNEKWIKLSATKGVVKFDERVFVSIDWQKAPAGDHTGSIDIFGAGQNYTVLVSIQNNPVQVQGFIEKNGVVSINAANYTHANNTAAAKWITVPNLGRTHSAVTISPANAEAQIPGVKAPYLEYDFSLFKHGEMEIQIYLSPTLNYKKQDGLKFAISIDNAAPQTINMHEGETRPDWTYPRWWNQSVTDHIKFKSVKQSVQNAGLHTLKIWMIDPGIVFQKIVIDAGGLKPSYLGPPESKRVGDKNHE